MEILNIVVKMVGIVILAIGVIMIYDARLLSKKLFSYSDKNESAKMLKIVGLILSIIGAVIYCI
jgi:uncharacterized protein YjeT (DUF2065 family)